MSVTDFQTLKSITLTPLTNLTSPTTWSRLMATLMVAIAHPSCQRGLLGTSLIAFGAFTPAFLPKQNAFSWNDVASLAQQWPGRILGTAVLLAGVALLLDAWLRLRPHAGAKPPVDLRAALALWSIPLLPVPPLFSNDAYSYAAQGQLTHLGMNPYEYGPSSVPGPFPEQVDMFWQDTPAPYGPLGLQIQHFVVDAVGHSAFPAAVAMRVPALLAVAVLAAVLPLIARKLGADEHKALWLGVANPLVVMHVVGGSHNDAIMIAGMAVGLWLALERRFVLACLVIAVAAAVKQPAVVAIAPIAALWATDRHAHLSAPFTSWREELRFQPRLMAYGAAVTALVVAGFCAVTWATGLGFGWIQALSVPGEVRTPLAPATMVGGLLEIAARNAGFTAVSYDVLDVVRTAFGLLGLGILVALWLRYGRTRPIWFGAWALITMALAGQALHAWYILWGGALLAACRYGPNVTRVAVWTSAVLVSYSAVDASFRNGSLALGVTAVCAVLWVATGHDRDLDRSRDTLGKGGKTPQEKVTPAAGSSA